MADPDLWGTREPRLGTKAQKPVSLGGEMEGGLKGVLEQV